MYMKEVKRRGDSRFKMTAVDRVISMFSPRAAFDRMRYRAATSALTGGYKGADKSRRSTQSWGVKSGSADADTVPYLDTLRARSRDLVRNAPLATGAINTVVTNTIGTGLTPQSTPDRQYLESNGISAEQIQDFTRTAERIFNFWALRRDCDASRAQNFIDIQDLVFRSVLESGDAFTIRRFIDRPGNPYKTALQVIEADRVDNPVGQQRDTEELTAGIKRTNTGEAVGYYFLKQHPGHIRMVKNRYQADFVPAYFKNGEWQVLHHFTKLRPEQTRGIPYLAPVIEALKQLDRYTEAEIDAAVVSAMFTVFVKTEDGEGMAPHLEQNETASHTDTEVKLGNAAIIDLMKGEDIEIANPGRPNQAFDPFVLAILRQIGVALEIPFELLVKHFTASYSAAQAAMVEAWKFFKSRRRWVVNSLCDPVYEAIISEAVALGDLSAPGFFNDPYMRAAWLKAHWIGPPRGLIRLDQEVKAYATMEDRQWKTSAEITAELTGGDWAEKSRIRAGEESYRRDHSLLTPDKTPESSAMPGEMNDAENPDKEDNNE